MPIPYGRYFESGNRGRESARKDGGPFVRLRCRPWQKDPFRNLDGLIWGHDGFLAPVNCTSTRDRHVTRQRECKYSEEHSLRL